MRAGLRLLLALLALVAASTRSASAESRRFGENPSLYYQSPQRFALEIKFGPFSPNIDASAGLNGNRPFADLFPPAPGSSRPPAGLLTQIEFDYEFLRKPYGTFAIGHTIGFHRRTTQSFAFNIIDGQTVSCNHTPENPCLPTGDTTSLNVIPLSLLAVYRFDYLAQRWRIPFVPYMKIGLAYSMWWIENGSGFLSFAEYLDPATGQKDQGYGGTLGWVLNPGGAFLLDVLDSRATRTIDSELGINHTYLFCELHYADISGFGAAGKMNLSDTTLNAGIGFEF